MFNISSSSRMAWRGLLLSLFIVTPAVLLAQGALTPPGPAAPIMKTLDQIEPRIPIGPATTPGDDDSVFRIAAPGSYYLTGDVTGESGKHGIEIAASRVTLDLKGFRVISVIGAKSGIYAVGGNSFAVSNGVIVGWPEGGIAMGNYLATRFENLSLYSNAPGASLQTGDEAIIRNCIVKQSGGRGIDAGDNSIIESCIVGEITSGGGIFSGDNSTVKDCTVNDIITGSGISVGENSIVEGCTISAITAGNGIFTGLTSIVRDCVVRGAGSDGIAANSYCIIESCTVNEAEIGINAGFNAIIRKCSVYLARSHGIEISTGGEVADCSVRDSGGAGIYTSTLARIFRNSCEDNGDEGIRSDTGSIIDQNNCSNNDQEGIRVSASSIVTNNRCSNNGQAALFTYAGILATGASNRIEGNQCVSNDQGIKVDVAGNFIVRNTARANTTDFDITGTQTIGPIITATGTITSTNPWANFEF